MINKQVKVCFVFALLFSTCFPCGVLLIVFKYSNPIILALGIVVTVLGFYGTPLMWIKFGELKSIQNICNQIVLDNLQEVNYLAKINNVDEKVMLKKLHNLITKRYLIGYEIVDDKYIVKQAETHLTKNDAMRLAEKTSSFVCQGCGASVEIVDSEETFCSYCGRPINKNKIY